MTAPLIPGQKRKLTSVSLTHEQQIQLRRLGGSKWLRAQIDKATPKAVSQPPAFSREREEFEGYLRGRYEADDGWFLWVHGDADHTYVYSQTEWEAWRARAALAA